MRAVASKADGWEAERTTRARTRCGCFLPDLTGLARRPSAADLPPWLYHGTPGLAQAPGNRPGGWHRPGCMRNRAGMSVILASRPNVYTGSPLDRADRFRNDEAWIAGRLADPASLWVPVWRARTLFRGLDEGRPEAVFLAGEAASGSTAFVVKRTIIRRFECRVLRVKCFRNQSSVVSLRARVIS